MATLQQQACEKNGPRTGSICTLAVITEGKNKGLHKGEHIATNNWWDETERDFPPESEIRERWENDKEPEA